MMTIPTLRTRPKTQSRGSRDASDIPSLTGIRALAVTMVFLTHAGAPDSPAPLGVTIFFFLSGYLITTLLRREFDRTGTISLRAFYLRRACRILPPLYIVLILADLMTLGGAFSYDRLSVGGTLSQFFFFSNYHTLDAGWFGVGTGTAPGTGVLWSLAVEEHFYLLFPAFYLILRRWVPSARRQAAVLAAVCGAVLLWRYVLILGLHASFDRTYVGTDTRIDSILFGCILGVLGNPAPDFRPGVVRPRLDRYWASVLAPIALLALALFCPWPGKYAPAYFRSIGFTATAQYTVEGLALIPLFVVAVRFANSRVFKLLNHPAVVLVGVLSYSMYISEVTIIDFVHEHFTAGQAVHGAIYLILTLLFAYAMYRFVEMPFGRLRKRLSTVGDGSRTGPAAESEAEDTADLRIRIHVPASSHPELVRPLAPGIQLD
jgi:peptidoglycan/LPS O-acetylase OafA/YrhL